MHFIPNEIYHVYNRSNQQQPLFLHRDNYLYFLGKIRHHIAPTCDVLAWCLMPNHFHLLLSTNELSVATVQRSPLPLQKLTESIRLLLSSYTKGFNKQYNKTGNLFQQKTKAKCVSAERYSVTVFHYIHQNPMAAGLVSKMEDWEFSSFADYAGKRNGTLCNQLLAYELLDLDRTHLYTESYAVITNEKIKQIF